MICTNIIDTTEEQARSYNFTVLTLQNFDVNFCIPWRENGVLKPRIWEMIIGVSGSDLGKCLEM
jgi:hypothetical protein